MSYNLPYLKKDLKKLSFLVFGLGSSGYSTIRYFKKKNFLNYCVWDDKIELRKKFSSKVAKNLKKRLEEVDYIILSPGISLKKTKYKNYLLKFKKKIITDIIYYIWTTKT